MSEDSQQAPRRYASIADGAHYAAVSGRTLRRLIDEGQLTGYRVGPRVLRIDLNELDALFTPTQVVGR